MSISQCDCVKMNNLLLLSHCRENELLKHQLRKYVGAVQMLRQQEGHNEEADMYEKKLVQVIFYFT